MKKSVVKVRRAFLSANARIADNIIIKSRFKAFAKNLKRVKAALEEFKGGSAIAVVGFAAKLSCYPFKALAKNVESLSEYG